MDVFVKDNQFKLVWLIFVNVLLRLIWNLIRMTEGLYHRTFVFVVTRNTKDACEYLIIYVFKQDINNVCHFYEVLYQQANVFLLKTNAGLNYIVLNIFKKQIKMNDHWKRRTIMVKRNIYSTSTWPKSKTVNICKGHLKVLHRCKKKF